MQRRKVCNVMCFNLGVNAHTLARILTIEGEDKRILDLKPQTLEPEITTGVQPRAETAKKTPAAPLHEEIVVESPGSGPGVAAVMEENDGADLQEGSAEPFSASKYFDTDKENLTKFFKESVEGMDAIAERGEAVARNMLDLKQAITNKRKALELALMS